MIKEGNLDFWIQNNYNVLLIGEHGVGKTSIVKEAFERNNLRWRYYSASTMDPWVDLVGVPKERHNEDGSSYLDLVRPKEFQEDAVEALFFDEFNRSHKKVRNAVMELLQFKSINGKSFPNLRLIWAAINPEDEDVYDVERLDPAQEDRFHIKVEVPYTPHRPYFNEKYGHELSKAAISWWKNLPTQIQKEVSPRRLDYALDIYSKKGDIRYVLPKSSNVSKLLTVLRIGPATDQLKKFFTEKDVEGATQFLSNENNYEACFEHIKETQAYLDFFLPCLDKEKIASQMSQSEEVYRTVLRSLDEVNKFQEVVTDIVDANVNKKLVNQISKSIQSLGVTSVVGVVKEKGFMGSKPILPFYNNSKTTAEYQRMALNPILAEDKKKDKPGTKDTRYSDIRAYIPAKISVAVALQTLKILSDIFKCEPASFIISKKDLIPICNHCINQICIQEGIFEWKIFVKKYSTEVGEIVAKCRQEKTLGIKLYIPRLNAEKTWYDFMGKPIPNIELSEEQLKING